MNGRLRRLLVVSLLVVTTLVAPQPAQAGPEDFPTQCPWMTDSIYRLYQAVFLREPDAGGFEGWAVSYSSGGWHLLRIAQFFTESPEFQERYGALSDEEFVDQIYMNVFGRPADAGGKAHWVTELQNGTTRGKVLLFFSESAEYIAATSSVNPLAGILRSYTSTTHWNCSHDNFTMNRQDIARRYWDVFMVNYGETPNTVTISFVDEVGTVLGESSVETVPGQAWGFLTNIDIDTVAPTLSGRVFGLKIEVERVEELLFTTVVGTNVKMPDDRPGWEGDGNSPIGADVAATVLDQ